jgi:hypothetical protein
MSRRNLRSEVSSKTFSSSPYKRTKKFKSFRAKSQRVIREAKHTSWEAFVSSLSWSTRSDVVWNKLRCMSGECNRTLIPGISVGGTVITSQADIANTIAPSFSLVCSSDNYGPCFRAIKNSAETLRLNFTPRSTESYNTPSVWTTRNFHLWTPWWCISRALCSERHHNAAASRPPASMVSTTKCSLSFHPQVRSLYCPFTIEYGQRARRGRSVHVLTGGCTEGSQGFLSFTLSSFTFIYTISTIISLVLSLAPIACWTPTISPP